MKRLRVIRLMGNGLVLRKPSLLLLRLTVERLDPLVLTKARHSLGCPCYVSLCRHTATMDSLNG